MVTVFVNERCKEMETQLKTSDNAQMRRNSQSLVSLATFIAKYNMYRIRVKNVCVEIKNASRGERTYTKSAERILCASVVIHSPVCTNNRERRRKAQFSWSFVASHKKRNKRKTK